MLLTIDCIICYCCHSIYCIIHSSPDVTQLRDKTDRKVCPILLYRHRGLLHAL